MLLQGPAAGWRSLCCGVLTAGCADATACIHLRNAAPAHAGCACTHPSKRTLRTEYCWPVGSSSALWRYCARLPGHCICGVLPTAALLPWRCFGGLPCRAEQKLLRLLLWSIPLIGTEALRCPLQVGNLTSAGAYGAAMQLSDAEQGATLRLLGRRLEIVVTWQGRLHKLQVRHCPL